MAMQVFKVRVVDYEGKRMIRISNQSLDLRIQCVPNGDELSKMGIRTLKFFLGQLRADGSVQLLSETSWACW